MNDAPEAADSAGIPDDLLSRAGAMAALARDKAPESERARGLPADLVEALAAAGLFRSLLPASVGGLECDPMTALHSMRIVGRADASAGWCVMIGATAGYSAAWLDSAVPRRTHADPATVTGGVFAPMGRAVVDGDGLVVDGQWAWFSGHGHCRWLAGGCVLVQDGEPCLDASGRPRTRMVFFPIDAAESLDGWHVAGLSGTGSGVVRVRALRVPWTQSVSLTDEPPREAGPLYRMPVFGLLAQGIAAVMLGNARGAVDDLIELAGAKRPQGSRRTLADRSATQAEVARAIAMLDAAEAGCDRAVEELWRSLRAGAEISLEQRARLRGAATWATRTAADVARAMYDLAGGSSVFLDHPLQRRFRDAHVGTQHMMVGPASYELAGRVMMQLPADTTLL